MIRLLDGPGAGVTLSLRLAPLVLRVTRAPDGTWDGLDQGEDEPRRDEMIHVYLRDGQSGYAHIDYLTKQGRRGMTVAVASYRYLEPQPQDHEVRSRKAWHAWCNDRSTT